VPFYSLIDVFRFN